MSHNGEAHVTAVKNGQSKTAQVTVTGLPEPLAVSGTWRMTLEGYRFPEAPERGLAVAVVDRRSTDEALLGHRTL